MPEEKGVTENSPSPLAEAIASSPEVTEQTQDTQTPPAEKGESQEQETQQAEEESRVPYSRLKEVVDEKNWLKQQLEQTLQQRPIQPLPQPTTDPYAGFTPEEERFWRVVDERAKKIAQQELQQVRPVIDAGRMELAQMKVAQFRSEHPDIKSNSPEEMEIAQRIQMGYSSNDAYWAVMGPRGIRTAEEKGKQQLKQQIEAKKKANVETSASVPAQSQPAVKRTVRETAEYYMQLAEEGKI